MAAALRQWDPQLSTLVSFALQSESEIDSLKKRQAKAALDLSETSAALLKRARELHLSDEDLRDLFTQSSKDAVLQLNLLELTGHHAQVLQRTLPSPSESRRRQAAMGDNPRMYPPVPWPVLHHDSAVDVVKAYWAAGGKPIGPGSASAGVVAAAAKVL